MKVILKSPSFGTFGTAVLDSAGFQVAGIDFVEQIGGSVPMNSDDGDLLFGHQWLFLPLIRLFV